MTADRRHGPFPWLVVILALPALAILLSLGTWQVKRLAWKENLLAVIDERITRDPVALGDVLASQAAGNDIEYTPVTVAGSFDHGREQFFFATHKGNSGFYVYTPLSIDDGKSLWVNRGFVPFDRKDASSRMQGQVEGEVTVTGLARGILAEKPSFLVPENDPAKNIFYWKDIGAMATNAGLDPATVIPLFVDASDAPNPGGLPVGGVTLIDLPNNHLQYAVTWYGLAAALAAVAGVFLWRRTRPVAPSA